MRRLTVELIPDLEHGGFTARVPDIPAYGEGDTLIRCGSLRDTIESVWGSPVCEDGKPMGDALSSLCKLSRDYYPRSLIASLVFYFAH